MDNAKDYPEPVADDSGNAVGDDLSAEARRFLSRLHGRFSGERLKLLAQRQQQQATIDRGELPDFAAATQDLREAEWTVRALPKGLDDRRVELTGPVDRKTLINGLNAPAMVFMADFEDSTSPTWSNILDGHRNVADAVRGDIEYRRPRDGKIYRLHDSPARLMVRPRGLHLVEKHLRFDGEPIAATLFDLGLYLFNCGKAQAASNSGPYVYIPKLQDGAEARWINDVLAWCEAELDLERGTVRTTVLIETLPAVFQMHEILHAMQERIMALNCGRWDYIFSYIKTLRGFRDRILPDRAQVGMGVPFLSAYSRSLIQACHRRGALAMGGMAAQVPVRGDEARNTLAVERVAQDKRREVANGHDGTWIAHPALFDTALSAFTDAGVQTNQRHVIPTQAFTAEDLLAPAAGSITEEGLRGNAAVAIEYLGHWLNGTGCVAIHHLMEDAATAEIARSQLWQWAAHGAALPDGSFIDFDRIARLLEQEGERLHGAVPRVSDAVSVLRQCIIADSPADFLTTAAYDLL